MTIGDSVMSVNAKKAHGQEMEICTWTENSVEHVTQQTQNICITFVI